MAKLYVMESIVLQVLKENPAARSDDYILMLLICQKIDSALINEPFESVMKFHKVNGLPNWETVTRCRRKIQAKYPELVSPVTARKRRKEEAEYMEYARS